MTSTLPRRGEVWWSELTEFGRRPVVVLPRDAAIPRLRRVLVAPCTTTIPAFPAKSSCSRATTRFQDEAPPTSTRSRAFRWPRWSSDSVCSAPRGCGPSAPPKRWPSIAKGDLRTDHPNILCWRRLVLPDGGGHGCLPTVTVTVVESRRWGSRSAPIGSRARASLRRGRPCSGQAAIFSSPVGGENIGPVRWLPIEVVGAITTGLPHTGQVAFGFR